MCGAKNCEQSETRHPPSAGATVRVHQYVLISSTRTIGFYSPLLPALAKWPSANGKESVSKVGNFYLRRSREVYKLLFLKICWHREFSKVTWGDYLILSFASAQRKIRTKFEQNSDKLSSRVLNSFNRWICHAPEGNSHNESPEIIFTFGKAIRSISHSFICIFIA